MAKKYIPKLYDSDEVTLIDNIHDVIECKIREERNGIFELTLDYPASSPLLYEFKKERVIVANASPKLRNQMFVIYKVCRYMKKKIKVIARHISFDLLYDSCSELKLENASCEYVLNSLFRNSRFSREFRGFSDIINAQNYSIENVNILKAIAGKEGSIIDTFGTGAEILRDNKNFHVLKKRGHDNGVSIEYGINLTGFECYEDTTDLVTCIRPFATYRNEDSTETTVRGDFVESPRAGNYKHLYIKHIDYTNKFEAKEVPTPTKLNELAAQDFRTGSIDIPKMRYEIKFIPLSQCVGYENFQDAIGLCDIVTVKNRVYNVDDKAKVVATVFDPIKDRYESMELGEPRSTLGSILSGSDGKDGQNGKDGKDGKDGQDGNVENMPDTLPETPVLTSKVYGMGSIELSWTFENKLYYTYELYASRTKDFTPNVFDLIHAGQSSSFKFNGNPGENWYFKVCAINSHNNRTPFSNQVEVVLTKVEDMNNYFSEMAIGKAVVQSLSADYMEAGIIKAHWVELKGASVIDGNGKRTFDIDSFGRITLMPSVFKMMIDGKEEGVVTESKLLATKNELSHTITEIGSPNIVSNSDFEADGHNWFIHAGATIDYNANSYLGNQYGKMIGITSNYGGGLFQKIKTIPGEKYTVSFYALAQNLQPLVTNIGIEGINVISLENEPGFKRWTFEFVATKEIHTFVAYAINPGTFFIGRIMINKGPLREYSSRQDEIYSKTVRLDGTGVNIESPNCSTKTNIDTNGMEVIDTKDNTSLLSAKDGDVVAKGGHFKVSHPENGEIILWGRDVVINGGRALVGTGNVSLLGANKLFINYNNDFFKGVHIGGSVSVEKNLQVDNHDVVTSKGFVNQPFGYQILSTGLILQWGTFSGFGDGDTLIHFAIEFPNACAHFNCTFEGDADTMFDVHGYNVSRNGANVVTKFMYGFNDRSRMVKWFAIGY